MPCSVKVSLKAIGDASLFRNQLPAMLCSSYNQGKLAHAVYQCCVCSVAVLGKCAIMIFAVCISITLGAFFTSALDFKGVLCSSTLGMRHVPQPLGRCQEKRIFRCGSECCGRCLLVVKRRSRRLFVGAPFPILFRAWFPRRI